MCCDYEAADIRGHGIKLGTGIRISVELENVGEKMKEKMIEKLEKELEEKNDD
jgi:hypothetical protein